MTHEIPSGLPGVHETPVVTRLEFEAAGVTVEGRFRLNEFALLPAEPLEFLRLYVRVRGNLKEVERMMGVSYPTVRARFESTLRALGYEAPPPVDEGKDNVLGLLERGEIDAAEALERLKSI